MSTHYFQCEVTLSAQVQLRYDVSSGEFVMEIDRPAVHPESGHSRVLYTSRFDSNFPGDELQYCLDVLADMDIPFPASMYRDLEAEVKSVREMRERVLHHQPDGRIVEERNVPK
jgi:hypothetical protein